MTKMLNRFNQCVLTAAKGMALTNGEIYTKIYISNEDIDETAWTEIPDSEVPVNDEIPDSEALSIITEGEV